VHYDDGSAVSGNSGEDVTDFPDQWHTLKACLSSGPDSACVPIVCHVRFYDRKPRKELLFNSRSPLALIGNRWTGRGGLFLSRQK
jgi:hypothetical protein